MWGSSQFVASKRSPPVSVVLRVISHRIPIPGWKSRLRSSPGIDRTLQRQELDRDVALYLDRLAGEVTCLPFGAQHRIADHVLRHPVVHVPAAQHALVHEAEALERFLGAAVVVAAPG